MSRLGLSLLTVRLSPYAAAHSVRFHIQDFPSSRLEDASKEISAMDHIPVCIAQCPHLPVDSQVFHNTTCRLIFLSSFMNLQQKWNGRHLVSPC